MRKSARFRVKGRFFFWITRICLAVLLLWAAGILLFAFLPVPFSAVMVQKQLGAWVGGNFSYVARHQWVSMDDISPNMALAVIASEDQKFLIHWGFDVNAIESAINHNERRPNKIRGGSTLSQQTAKNLFLWNGRSWVRKGLEAGLTVGIELVWTKRRILTVYLNVAEFGDGVFGVEQAAQQYFGKSAKNLTQAEAARLAAVLPSPVRLKANKPSGYVLQRQNAIMRQMNLLGGREFIKDL
ncbi:monofunctional biosynthetic peptidoglycan transglycosylase [Budvicia diplopodorum]|uniref:monofunctional biosynthetic peptidoglycan transglycosylase n=1 Tax=Budvicia diplopodorum TaxID=1119056 RepID=UPI00135C0F91|nr:monofunctional biosynthetic peptidoglycan transglycosylase [Budvicia diplopodorum]